MRRSLTLGLGLLALGFTTPVAAQTLDFADELHQIDQAVMGIGRSSSDFKADLAEVTRLHAHVLALRQPTDPARFDCLMDQASLLLAAGDAGGARRLTAQAVGQAQAHGDALYAAEASAVAAVLAQQAGDFQAERVFRINARNQALAPGVTPTQSAAIAQRLYGAAWKAAARGYNVLADD